MLCCLCLSCPAQPIWKGRNRALAQPIDQQL